MSRRRFSLRPSEADRLLWMRSLEESDEKGALLPQAARTAASRDAEVPEDEAFLLRRASLLINQLPPEQQAPPAGGAPAGSWWQRLPRWAGPAVWALAFAAGAAGHTLGPAHLVHILSFPLLGLILWNLCVCLVSLWAEWKKKPLSAPPVERPDASDAARAYHHYRAVWDRPRASARLAVIFHAAAIALTVGLLAGMYVQGLGKAYTVTWESTFLNEPQVRAVTRTMLGPASVATGIPVPEPRANSSAAPWIHLWAASAVLFIIIPRVLLINIARRRGARHEPDYGAEFGPWLERCRTFSAAGGLRAEVLSLYHTAESRTRDAVRDLIRKLWGAAVGAEFHPAMTYGSEQLPSVTAPPQYLAVIANLAATPEAEVHGAVLRTLAGTAPRDRRVLVLDAGAFAARFRSLPEYADRLAARRAAWEKTAGDFPVVLTGA
jgi:hypothetical protein